MLGLGKVHTNMGTSANAQDQEERHTAAVNAEIGPDPFAYQTCALHIAQYVEALQGAATVALKGCAVWGRWHQVLYSNGYLQRWMAVKATHPSQWKYQEGSVCWLSCLRGSYLGRDESGSLGITLWYLATVQRAIRARTPVHTVNAQNTLM